MLNIHSTGAEFFFDEENLLLSPALICTVRRIEYGC